MNLAFTLRCVVIMVLPLLYSFVSVGQPQLPGISCVFGVGRVEVAWQCQYDGVKLITVNRSFDSLGRFERVGELNAPEQGLQHYFDANLRPGSRYYKLAIEFNSGLVWQSNVCRMFVDTACNVRVFGSDAGVVKDTTKPGVYNQLSVFSLKRIVLPRPIDNIAEPLFVIPIHVGVQKNTGHVFVRLSPTLNREKHSIDFYDLQGFAVLSIADLRTDCVLIEKRNFQHRGVYKFVLKREGSELESGYITLIP